MILNLIKFSCLCCLLHSGRALVKAFYLNKVNKGTVVKGFDLFESNSLFDQSGNGKKKKKVCWHLEFISKLTLSRHAEEGWFVISETLFSSGKKMGVLSFTGTLISPWQSHCSVFNVVYYVVQLMCSAISQAPSLLIKTVSGANLAVSFEKRLVYSCYKYSQHMSMCIIVTNSRSLSSYEWFLCFKCQDLAPVKC